MEQYLSDIELTKYTSYITNTGKQWATYSAYPDSKVHGANMGPIWVLSAPDGAHIGPMNFALRVL